MLEHRWSWTSQATLPSCQGAHLPYLEDVLARLKSLGWEGRDLFGVEMALEESLSNAIRHGNCFDTSKQVAVACKISPQRFWLRVEDQGGGFKPGAVPDCTAEENLECAGGRGLALIKAYMTRVEYNEQGNCVTLEKVRAAASDEATAGQKPSRPCEPGDKRPK